MNFLDCCGVRSGVFLNLSGVQNLEYLNIYVIMKAEHKFDNHIYIKIKNEVIIMKKEKDVKIPQSEIKKIPKLPKGEGSISLVKDGTKLMYRKVINKKRETVYGNTVSEVFKKMREKEKSGKKVAKIEAVRILENEIYDYLFTVKKPKLKPKSFARDIQVFENQIQGYSLAKMRIPSITSKDIQMHLNILNEKMLSYSTIKKTYYLLNQFFEYIEDQLDINPMKRVEMISKANVYKGEKNIYFMKDDEIIAFEEEYKNLNKVTKNQYQMESAPVYYLGSAFVFTIFTGLRVGELIALKWKDINFKDKYIHVYNSIELIENPKYDINKKELMKKKGVNKYISVVQDTKNYQKRMVPLPQQSIEALMFHRKYSQYLGEEDYVFGTKNGVVNTVSNLNRSLRAFYVYAIKKHSKQHLNELELPKISMHTLRHTCASLYFRHTNLKVEEIAANLGHSPEVCRTTYIHLVEERRVNGAAQMSEIRFEVQKDSNTMTENIDIPKNPFKSSKEFDIELIGELPNMFLCYTMSDGNKRLYSIKNFSEEENENFKGVKMYNIVVTDNNSNKYNLHLKNQNNQWKVVFFNKNNAMQLFQ